MSSATRPRGRRARGKSAPSRELSPELSAALRRAEEPRARRPLGSALFARYLVHLHGRHEGSLPLLEALPDPAELLQLGLFAPLPDAPVGPPQAGPRQVVLAPPPAEPVPAPAPAAASSESHAHAQAHAHAQGASWLPILGRRSPVTRALRLAHDVIRRTLGPYHRGKLTRLTGCRTGEDGAHLVVCPESACQAAFELPHSCHDRACPQCSAEQRARWEEKAAKVTLPVRHHHVVFTTPRELRRFAQEDPARFFRLLMEAANETVLGHCEQAIGARVGLTSVLHTWSKRMRPHYHAHLIVTDGGLTEDGRWIEGEQAPGGYLLPARALMERFRDALIGKLARAFEKGKLPTALDEAALARLLGGLKARRWEGRSYRRNDLGSSELLYTYLGRYACGMVIHDGRIVELDEEQGLITIRLRKGIETMTVVEFARRFVQHFLPRGLQRIRHAGLYANNKASRQRREQARALLLARRRQASEDAGDAAAAVAEVDSPKSDVAPPQPDATDREEELPFWLRYAGRDHGTCFCCGVGRLRSLRLDGPTLAKVRRREIALALLVAQAFARPPDT